MSAEIKIEVLNAFDDMQSSFQRLETALERDQNLVSWTHDTPNLKAFEISAYSHRMRAYAVLKQQEYLCDQDPREILICPGFIGSSSQTMAVVADLNAAKERFKQSILRLREAGLSREDPMLCEAFESKYQRQPGTNQTLKKMGLARLHLKQCYRKVPYLPHAPAKISWTWAHTRSIKRISVQEAEHLLLKKKNDPGITKQLSLLATLSPSEPLAIVQELAPHLRANILFCSKKVDRVRMMIKGPIPIFFPADVSTPPPEFKPPGQRCDKNPKRLTRKDARLDPQPFLPAIRVHRYLKALVPSE